MVVAMAHRKARSQTKIPARRKTRAERELRPKDELREVLLETYAANDAMNQLLLEHLDPRAWRCNPQPKDSGEGRTLAAIFAHLHNNRLSWIRNSAPHLRCPKALDPERCTIKQARAAHRQSAARCLEMLKDALSNRADRRVTRFSRGSWAQPWPAGATMFSYMFAHEAHHRGQIIMLARQVGYPLPDEAAYGIWRWEKLWKQSGFETLPR
jgi:uncharacterized damage-inducible protein DinB